MQEQNNTAQQYYGSGNYSKINDKDDNFLKWFLENKQGIENLKFLWRGWERDMYGRWVSIPGVSDKNRMMNEEGIHWATAVMENYLDRVFQSTNWNDEHMNYEMRKAYRVVWFGLMKQYKRFSIQKVNCYGIATQILSRIHAILLASRGDGIRKFIGTTQTITENRMMAPQQNSTFSGLRSLFRPGGQ
jgi:hypothetical protein